METWDDAIEAYDEMLDSMQDEVRVGALTWAPSVALRGLDPIAYRVGLHDFIDSEGIDSDDLKGDMLNVP